MLWPMFPSLLPLWPHRYHAAHITDAEEELSDGAIHFLKDVDWKQRTNIPCKKLTLRLRERFSKTKRVADSVGLLFCASQIVLFWPL